MSILHSFRASPASVPRWEVLPSRLNHYPPLCVLCVAHRYGLQASAVAVVRACADAGVENARVKWPNDVWIGGKKVSGMIMRTEKELDREAWRGQIGIGININEDLSNHPEIGALAVSVRQALGGLWINRERFLAHYLNELEALLDTNDPKAILGEYRKHSLLQEGTEILVHEKGFEHEGYPAVVKGIADDFRLMVIRNTETLLLSAEEVSIKIKSSGL